MKKYFTKSKNGKKIIFAALILFLFSCQDFIEVDTPKTKLVSSSVFTNDVTATAAISAIYNRLLSDQNFASGGLKSLTFLYGLSSDELTLFSQDQGLKAFYDNTILPTNTDVDRIWGDSYYIIYSSNAIIEGLAKSTGVSAQVKKQLEGESKFIRAFCHFYLVNLFGSIPYITTTDYRLNAVISRSPNEKVYQSIITDLQDAISLLSSDYVTGERVRPNKWAAVALLSRAYLYAGDWENAEIFASEIIENTDMYSLVDLNDVFLKNSQETIWQLMPIIPGTNTLEGSRFISTGIPQQAALNAELLDAFESTDNRKNNWIGSVTQDGDTYYFPYKYKLASTTSVSEEYSMVLRLAEQYLIRAEARLQNDKLTGQGSAEDDVNVIRNRAGLGNTTAKTKDELTVAILQERRLEFFSEWGHRWFDLKRTNKLEETLNGIKPGFDTSDTLLPIPESEILVNPNLKPQNPGY